MLTKTHAMMTQERPTTTTESQQLEPSMKRNKTWFDVGASRQGSLSTAPWGMKQEAEANRVSNWVQVGFR